MIIVENLSAPVNDRVRDLALQFWQSRSDCDDLVATCQFHGDHVQENFFWLRRSDFGKIERANCLINFRLQIPDVDI